MSIAYPHEPKNLRNSRLRDIGLWILGRRRRFRIAGNSMRPLLVPGEEVLIQPTAYGQAFPQPGDIVVAHHPQQPGLVIIKWVVFVEANGCCYLQGLNPDESTDSRSFGLVSATMLQGKVICRFP